MGFVTLYVGRRAILSSDADFMNITPAEFMVLVNRAKKKIIKYHRNI